MQEFFRLVASRRTLMRLGNAKLCETLLFRCVRAYQRLHPGSGAEAAPAWLAAEVRNAMGGSDTYQGLPLATLRTSSWGPAFAEPRQARPGYAFKVSSSTWASGPDRDTAQVTIETAPGKEPDGKDQEFQAVYTSGALGAIPLLCSLPCLPSMLRLEHRPNRSATCSAALLFSLLADAATPAQPRGGGPASSTGLPHSVELNVQYDCCLRDVTDMSMLARFLSSDVCRSRLSAISVAVEGQLFQVTAASDTSPSPEAAGAQVRRIAQHTYAPPV